MPSRYVSMRKISLKRECRDRLEAEYNLRRHSPSAIVFDFPLGKYPAFVMLTPQLHALIVKLYKDSALLSDLQTHALPGIAKQWYIRKILVDEIKLTNDIENVQSTRPEVKAAVDSVEGDAASRYIRFSGMAMKYASVITHSVDILRTCGDVRRLYDEFVEREVVEEDLRDTIDGQIFRSGPVYIQDSHGRVIHEGAYILNRRLSIKWKRRWASSMTTTWTAWCGSRYSITSLAISIPFTMATAGCRDISPA